MTNQTASVPGRMEYSSGWEVLLRLLSRKSDSAVVGTASLQNSHLSPRRMSSARVEVVLKLLAWVLDS